MMMRYGIARYVGSWVSASGYRLRIEKVHKNWASVDFLDPHGVPIRRPYMRGASSVKMIAHYDDYNDNFEVDLWEEGRGFILDLMHQYNFELDPERREALVPGLTDLSEIVFRMNITRYSARWITLCEEGRSQRRSRQQLEIESLGQEERRWERIENRRHGCTGSLRGAFRTSLLGKSGKGISGPTPSKGPPRLWK